MKPHTITLIIATLSLPGLVTGTETNHLTLAVRDLGVTAGKAVTNGFVFIEGRYIEPPYVVSRRGNGVYINEHLIEQPCPWPIPERPRLEIPFEDPKLPAYVDDRTSFHDPELTRYLVAKRDYNFYRLALRGKEFIDAMVKCYSELPFVREVKPEDEVSIEVTWKGGGKLVIRVVPFGRKPIEWTRESLLARLEANRAMYEARLEKGDFYFLGTIVGRTTGTSESAATFLPRLLEILKTSRNPKEVYQRFQAEGYANWSERAAEAFFSNRNDLEKFEKRVEALKQAEKDKEVKESSFDK